MCGRQGGVCSVNECVYRGRAGCAALVSARDTGKLWGLGARGAACSSRKTGGAGLQGGTRRGHTHVIVAMTAGLVTTDLMTTGITTTGMMTTGMMNIGHPPVVIIHAGRGLLHLLSQPLQVRAPPGGARGRSHIAGEG